MSSADSFSAGPGATGKIAGFFEWWGSELASLSPFQGARRRKPQRVIEIDDSEAVILRGEGKRTRELRRIDLAGVTPDYDRLDRLPKTGPALRLSSERVLTLGLTLPRAAETKLDLIVLHEFGARIPYGAEDAYFDTRIVKRGGATIEVELVCALRSQVDAMRAKLAAVGQTPSAVLVEGHGAEIDLLRRERNSGKGGSTALTVLLALAFLALLAAVIWVPLNQRQRAVEVLDQEIATARLAANQTLELESAAATLRERRQLVARELASGTPRIVLLNEISRLMPDSSWARRVTFQGDRANVSGEAVNAAPLIQLLGGSEYFTDPAFVSPVTTGRDNSERFELLMRIVEEGAQ